MNPVTVTQCYSNSGNLDDLPIRCCMRVPAAIAASGALIIASGYTGWRTHLVKSRRVLFSRGDDAVMGTLGRSGGRVAPARPRPGRPRRLAFLPSAR